MAVDPHTKLVREEAALIAENSVSLREGYTVGTEHQGATCWNRDARVTHSTRRLRCRAPDLVVGVTEIYPLVAGS